MRSKSELKRIAVQKGWNMLDYTEIQRRLDCEIAAKHPPKNPKVPSFPPAAEAMAQKLREIIDAGGEKATLAYGALSRLCVLWTLPGPHTVQVELTSYDETRPLDARARLSSANPVMVNDLMNLLTQLFPDGEGLPEQGPVL